MFRDFRSDPLPDGYRCDLCIIGAGPAGLTIARRFDETPLEVCLVESGGFEREPATDALHEGENVGHEYSISGSRLRFFGGSSNHWEGLCAPLNELDFEKRDWVPGSGWPITRAALDPYYERAHEILDLGAFQYDPARIGPGAGSYARFDSGKLVTRLWRHSAPTRFGTKYRAQIEASKNITCLLHANAAEFSTTADGAKIRSLGLRSLAGDRATIKAKRYVLACGGLENPRILLSNGLGNRHDVVGRYFLEHVHIFTTGTVVTSATTDSRGTNGRWWEAYQRFTRDGTDFTPGVCLSPDAQRREKLLNYAAMLPKAQSPEGVRPGHASVRLYVVAEQSPNLESRVMLADSVDAVGMKRLRLQWKLAETERATVEKGAMLVAQELGRLGLARFTVDAVMDASRWPSGVWGASHHMGTTRMSDDPATGVVDRDCRVHELENLYVAGSSVFPTGGYANPTLTIVALALRLAEHLKERPE